jgi:uroporphyrinogen III methyltransferase/synthase
VVENEMSERDEVTAPGVVAIVGAGPGDVGLITKRGRELIDRAEVIVYDSAVNTELLPPGARANGTPELYYVGKRGEERAVPHDDVRRLLITLARQGKRVVRLKGGDPFTFGHGSEDAQALFEAQIPFEIVPGITAGIAAPAYAGIPITHQSLTSSVTFVSGRDEPTGADTLVNWPALGTVGGTIVIYNGLKMFPSIARELMKGGMPGEIPAAAIQSGTRSTQRTVVATLETLAGAAELAALNGAVTIVIGWCVVLRDELAWFDQRPLFGKRIGIIPSAQSHDALQNELYDLGADVTILPAPVTARLDVPALRDDIDAIGDYGWLIFASPDAVSVFWEQLLTRGLDTRALAGVRVAAVGAQTAASLLDRGLTVDVLPPRFEAAALLDLLREREDVSGTSVLYVCDDADDGTFPDAIVAMGADVRVRAAFRYVYEGSTVGRIGKLLERGSLDLIVFTNAGSVAQYVRALGEDLITRAPTAAIDEATGDALRGAGVDVIADGGTAGVRAFADAIVRALVSV